MIEIADLWYSYEPRALAPRSVLAGLHLTVAAGEHVAVVGRNGCGKSTLLRIIIGLLEAQRGSVRVAGLDPADPADEPALRRTVGMVFQHPESQLVSTVVEEDVAFGPENLGCPTHEIRRRVEEALTIMDLLPLRHAAPHLLSGGQQQRVAIAGALALRPRYLLLDEPTSMLDPAGRREVMGSIQALHRQGTTILHVTHFMEEAAAADRVIALDQGVVAYDGPPGDLFAQPGPGEPHRLGALGLALPAGARMARHLAASGVPLHGSPLTVEDLAEALDAGRVR